jgi:hypothetical protein
MDVLDRNLKIFSTRFSDLYDKLIKDVDFTDISVVISTDKGIYYQWNQDGGKMPISNPRDPIKKTREAVSNMEHRLCCGLAPVVIIGLYPGYELEIIYRHFESRFANHNEPFRHIYVVIDSLPCLAGWLKAADRTDILEREEVLFYEVNEIGKITELCASDYNRSHLFIPVSTLPPNEINRVMEPLADFYLKRQKEETEWKNENSAYYDSIDDPTFARIISGQADRKPRLLMPVHTSSTVVQYSARDTCRIFEKMGWKTKILKMQYDLFGAWPRRFMTLGLTFLYL